MFLTAPMRLRTSRWVPAMGDQATRSRGLCLALLLTLWGGPLLLPAPGRGHVLALLERMALLVEVKPEALGELLDGSVELSLDLVAPLPTGDLLEELGLVATHVVGDPGEEPLDLVDRDPVEVAVGGGEDLHDLLLNGQRVALGLVEGLDQSF